MTGWIVCGAIAAVLALLLLSPVTLHGSYESKTWKLTARYLQIPIPLQGKEKNKAAKRSEEQKKSGKSSQKEASPSPGSDKKAVLQSLLPYWRELLDLVGRVLRAPSLDLLRLEVWVGGDDCVLQYGRLCAVTGAMLPVLENTFAIRKQKIELQCCFDRQETEFEAEAKLSLKVYEILALAFSCLIQLLRIRQEMKNTNKAVQTQ